MFVFAGALVFCTVGFGIGVTAIPLLLLLVDPQTAVVLINTVSVFMFSLVIWQTRQHIPLRRTLPIIAAGLVGVPVGILILRDADSALLRIAIAAFIIALTLLAAFNTRWTLPKSMPVSMSVGFVVSVMLNAFGVGGALLALALLSRRLSSRALRGSLSLYFLVIEGAGVVGYGVAGLLTEQRILLIGVCPRCLWRWASAWRCSYCGESMRRCSGVWLLATIIITSMIALVKELAIL